MPSRIIEVPDNGGPDNGGSTILQYSYRQVLWLLYPHFISAGVGFDLVTSNVTESDNATFELCITLTDIRGGLERNVTLEIRQIDFGLPTGAQSK